MTVDYYTLDKALDKIIKVGIEKIDGGRILIDTNDKLPDHIVSKISLMLMTCFI